MNYTNDGARAQVNNLYDDMQIEDLISQGELDYVEREMKAEDLLTWVGYRRR